jgi:hypothetical protein
MSPWFIRLATVCISLAVATTSAAEKSAPELLPPTTIIYAEVTHPKQVLKTVLEHPLQARLAANESYQDVLRGSEYRQLMAAVRMVETEMDRKWPEIVGSLAEGGLSLAVDADTNGIVLLMKAGDAGTPEKLRDVLLTVVRGLGQLQGKPDPIAASDYRGVRVHALDEIKFGIVRDWLVVTNQGRLGQYVVDQLLGDSGETLATNQHFQQAQQQHRDASGWAFLDVNAMRDRGVAKDLFKGRSDNPATELILGGLLANLQHTPRITAELELKSTHVGLTLTSPHDANWTGAAREFYFGPQAAGVAPTLLSSDDTVLALSAYRDIAGMWLHADDLFDQNVNDSLAQAESGLSTLFSGKDFGEEVLGELRPEIQVIVTRQDFTNRTPQPAIKLPAIAAVLRLRDPDTMRDDFRRTFQSLMGFLNVVGAMNGQPQLDFQVERGESEQVLTSNYIAEGSEQQSRQARINFNFSPAVAFVNDRMVVSSDTQLARDLHHIDDIGQAGANINTRARLDATVLHDILADNRSQLIAQNMLAEGNSKEEAEEEINALLEIVKWFRQGTLQLDTADKQLQLHVQVDFNID